ncbi:MAG: L-seryl-tRNA(Sec) selenium transferase [bacterium]
MSERGDAALRTLPKVDDVLSQPVLKFWRGSPQVRDAVREELQDARNRIRSRGKAPSAKAVAIGALERLEAKFAPRLRRVVNATGIIIHTNLGRAPLGEHQLEAMVHTASGYSTLEYDLDTGKRGSRHQLVTHMLTALTGAEDALVVNNNAAALLLALTTLAGKGEVIVSRGQLVEIGGSFRIPDICRASGVRMVEVGTTNRTRARDYRNAIGPKSRILLRVHPSNFRIEGFTEEVGLGEMHQIAREHDLMLVDDLGSGALYDTARLSKLPKEPLVSESIAAGADVVTFSGDKLLGGPQAGIAVGGKEAIARMRRHPLMRALRPDKLTFAALDATLRIYLHPEEIARDLPVWRMLSAHVEELERWGHALLKAIAPAAKRAGVNVTIDQSQATSGGGSLPQESLPSRAISFTGDGGRLTALQTHLRCADPPVIGYLRDGVLRLDLRTMFLEEQSPIVNAVRWALERMEE